ncbi:MAG: cytochrome c maturation protein CcmE [Deltaproteobacteria bacterium]|nr:cytochrome c maturation protein CcmE [Deltaproteobacteria bacterium]
MKKAMIGGGILIAGALGYALWGGLEENLVYFVTPTELLEKGDGAVGNPIRVGGVVDGGSVRVEGTQIHFILTDEKPSRIPVFTNTTPPQMFQEGIGVVVEGALQKDHRFYAERLMVKHGNEYRPPPEGKMPQQIYKQLISPSPSPRRGEVPAEGQRGEGKD